MARHRIDRAAVEASSGVTPATGIVARRCWIDSPYVQYKAILCHVVAEANNCRTIRHRLGFVTLVGEFEDVEMTELLFTSLLVQATVQMAIATRRSVADEEARAARLRSRLGSIEEKMTAEEPADPAEAWELLSAGLGTLASRSGRNAPFKRSFFVAYATRIESRLAESNRRVTADAEAELGNGFLPVLASRQRAVDEAVERAFGPLQESTVRVTDGAGWVAGTAAADLADLNVCDELRTG